MKKELLKMYADAEKIKVQSVAFLEKHISQTSVNNLAMSCMAFVFSCASVMPGRTPFGVAICAAYAATKSNLYVAVGAVLGYLLLAGGAGVKYACAVLLCSVLGILVKDENETKKSIIMPIAALVTLGVTALPFALGSGAGGVALVMCEALICGCFAYLYIMYRQGKKESGEEVGKLALYVTGLLCLSSLLIWDTLSPMRTVALFAAMIYTYFGGVKNGVFYSVALGALMDISVGVAPLFSGIYGLCSICVGTLKIKSRFVFAAIFTIINGVVAALSYANPLSVGALYECLFASVFFVSLPDSVVEKIADKLGVLTQKKEHRPELAKQLVNQKLSILSGAISQLSTSLATFMEVGSKPNDENISQIFDRAAQQVCKKCSVAFYCWEKDYVTTYGAMNDAVSALKKNNYIAPTDFPSFFAARCVNIKGLAGAVNDEYSLMLRRFQQQKRNQEGQRMIKRQYDGINGALDDITRKMENPPQYLPTFESRIVKILSAYDEHAKVSVYTKDGRTCVEIYNFRKDLVHDIPQISESIGNSLGRDFYKAEEILTKNATMIRIMEKECLKADVNVAYMQKGNEEVCGDCNMYFNTDDGRAVVMLSDGMGSGVAANQASQNALQLISRFVKAGCSLAESAGAVTPVLAIRMEQHGFVTLDLLEINMWSGDAQMIKYGAAATYVKRYKKVQKYASSSFPAGVESGDIAEPEPIFFKIGVGNCVIMVTDGILDTLGEEALAEIIKEDIPPRELANKIVENAGKLKDGAADDMTAIVVHIESTK